MIYQAGFKSFLERFKVYPTPFRPLFGSLTSPRLPGIFPLTSPSHNATPASRFTVSSAVICPSPSSSSFSPASMNQAGRYARGGRLTRSGSNSYNTDYIRFELFIRRAWTHFDILFIRIPMLRRTGVRSILSSSLSILRNLHLQMDTLTSTRVEAKFQPCIVLKAPTTHPVWCIPSLRPAQQI